MATQLKDIQFSSPVMQGTTANNSTTWEVAATDKLNVLGQVTFNCGQALKEERHYGCEYHYGSESHCGTEYHYGSSYYDSGMFVCGSEGHSGCEYHCGSENHCGAESHSGYEQHTGTEYHCGTEDHYGFVKLSGTCGCSSDGYTGTNVAVTGITVLGGNGHKIRLTYDSLIGNGFTPDL